MSFATRQTRSTRSSKSINTATPAKPAAKTHQTSSAAPATKAASTKKPAPPKSDNFSAVPSTKAAVASSQAGRALSDSAKSQRATSRRPLQKHANVRGQQRPNVQPQPGNAAPAQTSPAPALAQASPTPAQASPAPALPSQPPALANALKMIGLMKPIDLSAQSSTLKPSWQDIVLAPMNLVPDVVAPGTRVAMDYVRSQVPAGATPPMPASWLSTSWDSPRLQQAGPNQQGV